MLALASGPASADTLRRAVVWLANEVRSSGQAMRAANAQIATLAGRVASLETGRAAGAGGTTTKEAEFLRRETEARAAAMGRATEQMEATVRELSAHYGHVADRLETLEARLADSGAGVREALDRVALEVSGTSDFAELARAALRSGLVEGAVRELRGEVDRITLTQASGQQDALAHVAGRTAPLEGALHELRREVELVADETAASQETLRSEAYERLVAVAGRVEAVEGRLAEAIEAGGSTGSRVSELAESVGAMEARLGAVDERTVALAAMAADVEAVYQELDRVSTLTQARDGTVTRLTEWASPVEESVTGVSQQMTRLAAEVEEQKAALDEARQRIEAVSQEGQAAELDLRRRLGSAEPLAGELEGMYRELGRVVATVGEVDERLAALDTSASTHGDALDELRLRLDNTRVGVEELTSGLAARLRELEVLPGEVARVVVELDNLTAELGDTRQDAAMRHSAVSDTLSRLVSVPTDIEGIYRTLERVAVDLADARGEAAGALEAAVARIAELQSLPADVEGLYRELDRVAEGVRQRGEELAEVEARTAPLRSLDELRAEVGQVAAELRSEVEATAVELRGHVDGLGGEVVESRVETAGRLDTLLGVVRELERLPADIGALYRELERLDDIDRRRGEQLASLEARIAPEDMASIHTALEAASVAIRDLGTLPAEVEGLYRELDRLSELNRERSTQMDDLEQRVVPREVVVQIESEFHAIASDLVGTAEALQRRLVDVETLPAALDAALRDLDRLGHAVEDLRALETLPADVEGLYRELHRLDDESRQQDTKLTDIEGRTVPKEAITNLRGDLDHLAGELGSLPPAIDDVRRDFDATISGLRRDLVSLAGEATSIRAQADEAAAPLQSAIAELRRDLEAVREVTSAAEADDVLAFEGLKDLDGRLRAVESLPERVEKVFRELSRASGDAVTHQQGLLHDAVVRLHALESRVEAVEGLPADLEGLYAALFRVAESVKALREDPEPE